MAYKSIILNDHTGNHQLWEQFADFWNKKNIEKKRTNPNIQTKNVANLKAQYMPLFREKQSTELLFLNEQNTIVACMLFQLQQVGKPHEHARIWLTILPKQLAPNAIETIQKAIENQMLINKQKKLFGESNHPYTSKIYAQLGGKSINKHIHFQLKKAAIRQAVISKWLAKDLPKEAGLSVVFYNPMPESLIEKYVDFMNELFTHIPSHPLTSSSASTVEGVKKMLQRFEQQQVDFLQLWLFDKNQKEVGLTINATRPPNLGKHFEQWMTGIKTDYQGRGLAKWLKAKMLSLLLEKYPDLETIYTNCHANNLPMIAINQAMGYEINERIEEFIWKK